MTNSAMSRPLCEVDPEISNAIDNEARRQHEGLELIASENFVSEAVLEAAGSVFTNKYAEGYPGKRYYGGCEFTDVVETIARERAKRLFGAENANVQPHSGSQANQAAYAAILQRWRQCLSAHHRLRPHAPDRRQGRRILSSRYGALLRSGRRRSASIARSARAHRDFNHA